MIQDLPEEIRDQARQEVNENFINVGGTEQIFSKMKFDIERELDPVEIFDECLIRDQHDPLRKLLISNVRCFKCKGLSYLDMNKPPLKCPTSGCGAMYCNFQCLA